MYKTRFFCCIKKKEKLLNMGRKKRITINKARGVLYRTAKYLGDAQAVIGVYNAVKKGNTKKAEKIVVRRVATRVAGKFTGRGLGYMQKQTNQCFIATAIYGNPNAHEVCILREYRDNVLANSSLGRTFINFYYSGAGERLAYLIKRDWKQTIPTIKKGLDFIVERYSNKSQEIKDDK
jgi:hypothetical protein